MTRTRAAKALVLVDMFNPHEPSTVCQEDR